MTYLIFLLSPTIVCGVCIIFLKWMSDEYKIDLGKWNAILRVSFSITQLVSPFGLLLLQSQESKSGQAIVSDRIDLYSVLFWSLLIGIFLSTFFLFVIGDSSLKRLKHSEIKIHLPPGVKVSSPPSKITVIFTNLARRIAHTSTVTKLIAFFIFIGIGALIGYQQINVTSDMLDYAGYPTIAITSVIKGTAVSIAGHNFPPDDTFILRVNNFGTEGIDGAVVGYITTDSEGNLSDTTFAIPAFLANEYRIAIRLESPVSGFYTYNWFYNNTAP